MEISLLALVGIALGTMFFGYFFGLFEGRGQGYRRRKKEEPPDHELEFVAQEQPLSPAAVPVVSEPVSGPESWLVLAGEADGQPRLDLDGQRLNTAELTPAQHKRLIQLMIMMRPWVESPPRAREAVTTAVGPAPLAPNDSQPAGMPRTEKSMATSSLPAPMPGSSGVPGMPGRGDIGAPTSMVAQIDTILQARLQGTALGSRGIRLAESLNGGAIIFVGKQSYAGLADVPDPQVQQAIREAIAAWEKRYTPG